MQEIDTKSIKTQLKVSTNEKNLEVKLYLRFDTEQMFEKIIKEEMPNILYNRSQLWEKSVNIIWTLTMDGGWWAVHG